MTASTLRTGPRRFAVLTLLVALAIAPAMAQERFSGLTGEVRDASGAVLPGANVTITNKENGKLYTAVTGSDGVYRILDLEPGRYGVKFELSGFQPSEVPDVVLLLGKTLTIDSTLKVGTVQEAVTVTAESPLIDTRSTTIAHNVTAEEFDRIPKGRSFQNLAFASPSVNTGEIEGGIQVNGASGAENSFTIDGVTTNSLINGGSRQDAVFEYLQEVQVKTGGINAEYGGALGGVVSAVTKSGGNQYRGEAHYYFTGASTSAGPVQRLVLDPLDDRTVRYVQDVEQPNDRHEIGGSLGGPIVRDKLFFFGSWAPRYVRRSNEYLFTRSETDTIEQKQTFNSAFGKVNYDPTNRLRTSFSVLWTPTTSEGSLAAYDDSLANSLSSSKASNQAQKTRGFEVPQTSYAGTLDFTLNNSSLLSVRGGYFDDNYKDTGVPTFSSVSYQTSAVGLGYPIAADQLGGVGFQNTPRIQLSEFDHTKRGYVQADFIKAFTMGGSHNFKGGVGLPAHGQRCEGRLSRRRVRVGVLGPVVHQQRHRPNRSRAVWLLRGGRQRRPGPDIGGHLVALRAGPVDDPQPHAESRSPHGARDHPVVSHRRPGRRVQVRVWRQARPPDRRQLRRVQRWPAEVVWQLGPLLRLDEVRSLARRLWRRCVAGAVSLARHDRRVLALGNEHARPEPLERRSRQLPGQADSELRHGGSEPQADEPGCVQRGRRVPASRQHDSPGQLRARQPAAHDRGSWRARQRL